MRGVNFEDLEARGERAFRSFAKGPNDGVNLPERQRTRHRIAHIKCLLAGSHRLPSAVLDLYRLATGPRSPHAGLAPGMRQLHPRNRALLAEELCNRPPGIHVRVRVDTG